MKIQLKRSNQLQDYGNGNEAKRPSAAQMEYGELAVNYNTADPAIFMEDSAGNIVRIAGVGAEGGFSGDYNDLTNKPTIPTVGDGEITINQGGTEKGKFTVNQSGSLAIDLAEGAIYTAGNGIDVTGTVISAEAHTTKGIAVSSDGIAIGDDWSDIPARS